MTNKMKIDGELLEQQLFLCILLGSIVGLLLPIFYIIYIRIANRDAAYYVSIGYFTIITFIVSYNYMTILKIILAVTVASLIFSCTFAVTSIVVHAIITIISKIIIYCTGSFRKIQDVNTPLVV